MHIVINYNMDRWDVLARADAQRELLLIITWIGGMYWSVQTLSGKCRSINPATCQYIPLAESRAWIQKSRAWSVREVIITLIVAAFIQAI